MGTDSSQIFSYILENAPKDMCMLDVGSRSGKWLVTFVDSFPNAEFHCFEALPEQYERCKHRYRHYPQVKSYNVAIYDVSGPISFYRDNIRAGWSRIRKYQGMTDFDEIIVDSKTIDSFELKPFFIKIDIEGAELQALKGAIKTLETTKVIFFECNEVHYREYEYTSENLYDFLVDNNFRINNNDLIELSKEKFIYATANERRYDIPRSNQNFIAIKR